MNAQKEMLKKEKGNIVFMVDKIKRGKTSQKKVAKSVLKSIGRSNGIGRNPSLIPTNKLAIAPLRSQSLSVVTHIGECS